MKTENHTAHIETQATKALEAAKAHAHLGSMVSSAKSCITDAEKAMAEGKHGNARAWAVRSLSYSVGMFSPVYQAHAVAGIDYRKG